MLGDFSNYSIADAINTLEIQVLQELYAETNQVGLISRMDVDGMPTLAEAFVRIKLAA
jgi:HK97 family phage major capsid protein